MTKLAGPTKTSELEAYELKAETATSRDFVLGNITLPVGLNHTNRKHCIKLTLSNLSALQHMHNTLQKVRIYSIHLLQDILNPSYSRFL